MATGLTQTDARRSPVLVGYAVFVFIGLTAGVGGVLLPAQMRDYGVDRATIGLTFLTSSVGFVAAGATAGYLVQRCGYRVSLAGGTVDRCAPRGC